MTISERQDLAKYTVQLQPPSVEEFLVLRQAIGWDAVDKRVAKVSLANSLFTVIARDGATLIGMGRVVGDGAMYFYVQDVVIAPAYQKQGIGSLVMEQIEAYLSSVTTKGATIGLLSAKGREAFYRRYGYIERPTESLGNGMCKFVS